MKKKLRVVIVCIVSAVFRNNIIVKLFMLFLFHTLVLVKAPSTSTLIRTEYLIIYEEIFLIIYDNDELMPPYFSEFIL